MTASLFPHFNIKDFLKNLSTDSGVYQMIGQSGKVLYVGKAKNLKNRLQSYQHHTEPRIQALLEKVFDIIITVTHSEQQALTLESHLIKRHQPPYNILLKDQKSALYLSIQHGHPYPRLTTVRSDKHLNGGLGPFPSRELAQKTSEHLFKIFRLRSCSDHTFFSRKRPCLQYQIKQCSAPCVGYISQEDYQKDIAAALESMSHASSGLFDKLSEKMLSFSAAMEYEKAQATFEHIALLRSLQRQYHDRAPDKRLDILAIDGSMVQHVIIADGGVLDSRFLEISNPLNEEPGIVAQQVLQRCYDHLPLDWIPSLIILGEPPAKKLSILGVSITARAAETALEKQWLSLAQKSLWANSRQKNHDAYFWQQRFDALQKLLGLVKLDVIDTVDISHHQGDQALGGVIRVTRQGFCKTGYRYYYLNETEEHRDRRNDLDSIEETLSRHFKRCLEKECCADLVLVDGGKNQLNRAYGAWLHQNAPNPPSFICIAKAPGRRSGEETLYHLTGAPLEAQALSIQPQDQLAFLLLQQIRDEAHRFVIQRQRKRQRNKALSQPLDGCSFISSQLKKTLLTQFGGWDSLKKTPYEQLMTIPGIGPKKAAALIEYFRLFV